MADPVYRIHPAIGIVRVGNADRNSFFIGPELPGLGPRGDSSVGTQVPKFKVGGKLKPQAARFRIWEYVEKKGKLEPSREITLDEKDCAGIYWEVHLANRKASFFKFAAGAGEDRAPSARRNASVTDPKMLEIDPRPRSIPPVSPVGKKTRNAGPVEFRKGTSSNPATELWPTPAPSPPIEYLGELRTDPAGRLIVIGGVGLSSGLPGKAIVDSFNNDGWFDDIADGPVTATLLMTVKGKTKKVPVDGAWVLCGPPDFAPSLLNQVTLYDVLYDVAVKQMKLPTNEAILDTVLKPLADLNAELLTGSKLSKYTPSFDGEIFPIIQRAADTIFVFENLKGSHQFRTNYAVLGDPSAAAQGARRGFFDRIHKPGVAGTGGLANMPLMHGDEYSNATHKRHRLTLTDTQYALMERWVDGKFVKTAGTFPPARPAWMSTITPHGLDRAALENCVGGAFCVGIEVSWQIRNKKLYAAPFRIDHKATSQYRGDTGQIKAGHFSRQMALPWQADFFSCALQNAVAWWPAQRPIVVYGSRADFDAIRSNPAGPRKSEDWARPLSTWEEFVEHFYKLGLVHEGPPAYHLERERNSSVP